MKKLAMMLLLTLVGTIAQAAPSVTTSKFADDHCVHTDDAEACRADLAADRNTQMMNHYSLAIRICSAKNITDVWNRSPCFVEAAKEMRDRDFRKKVTDCRNDENFLGNGWKNKNWAKTVDCQSRLFGDRAADTDLKNTGHSLGGSSAGIHTGQ